MLKPLILMFLVCAGLSGHAAEVTPGGFQAGLREALVSGSEAEIERCFYWGDTPAAVRMVILNDLRGALRGREVLGVDLFDPADKRVNRNVIAVHCSGVSLDGRHFPLNLELQSIATISLRDRKDKGDSGSVYWVGVGRAPDGSLAIPGTRSKPDRIAD